MRPMEPTGESEAEFLAGYDPRAFPPVAVTADVVLLTVRQGRLSVLLIERANHPFRGMWALPGGFVEVDEDIDAAAQRELAEETGVAIEANWLEQLKTYGTPGRDPRMRVITVAYLAFSAVTQEPSGGDDARHARFFAVEDLAIPALGPRPYDSDGTPLAADHALVI